MHQSIATIDSPQFINLQPLDINPLMSSCEIKVLYLGENRNHSYISKEAAEDMAKSLRGAPIVGYFRDETQDFGDHGERIVIQNGEFSFECLTVPYGFVSPDAKVWFQKFEDTDDFGETIVREYLMTTGYIWTGQFEEAQRIIEEGRPHSMELDGETLDGKWSTNSKGVDFFIINDAVFSKLCVLGNDVEPCFEGSSVTAPNVSKSFTKVDDNFKNTLYSMMQDLRFALEGGKDMVDETNVEISETQDNVNEIETSEINETTEETTTTFSAEETSEVAEETTEVAQEEAPAAETEFAKEEEKEKEDEKESEEKPSDDKEEDKDEDEKKSYECQSEDDDDKKKYSLLEQKYNELETKFNAMNEEYQALVEFKATIDNAKKDDLINSFYMLDDADKAEVIKNKSKYSLEEIEAKLSIIFTRKQLAATSQREEAEEVSAKEVVTTYNMANPAVDVPDWVLAVRQAQENMN